MGHWTFIHILECVVKATHVTQFLILSGAQGTESTLKRTQIHPTQHVNKEGYSGSQSGKKTMGKEVTKGEIEPQTNFFYVCIFKLQPGLLLPHHMVPVLVC